MNTTTIRLPRFFRIEDNAMHKSIFIACLMLMPILTGCTVSDALFATFGEYHSGGGVTQADRRYDYDRQVEASRDYGARNP